MDRENIDKIVYRFKDSSTPPRFHRSYKITVTENEARVRVDVYGTELANEIYPIDSDAFKDLIASTENLDAAGKYIAAGATGTKGNTISLYGKEGKFYELHWDSLNKVGQGSLDFIAKLKELVPQLSELKKREIPQSDDGE